MSEWTEEDEALRLKAKEKRKEEMQYKAVEGVRMANKRVREDKWQTWFETQPLETQQRILRKKSALQRLLDNTAHRKMAICAALFHSWDIDSFCAWLRKALYSDLMKQYKVSHAGQQLGPVISLFDSRRSATTLDVIRESFSNLCHVIAAGKESDLLEAAAVPDADEYELLQLSFFSSSTSDQDASATLASGSSLISMDSRRLTDLQPLFAFVADLFSRRLSLIHSCRSMCKALMYAQGYAKVKAESDELISSMDEQQYSAKLRLIEVDVLRQTYPEITQCAQWVEKKLKLGDEATTEWVQMVRNWVTLVLLERYVAEERQRQGGEALAASRLSALYQGWKSRRFVREVWRRADEELRLQLESESSSDSHVLLGYDLSTFSDVVDAAVLRDSSSLPADDEAATFSSTHSDMSSSASTYEPLLIQRVEAAQGGFSLFLLPPHTVTSHDYASILRKVAICAGVITRHPRPSSHQGSDHLWRSGPVLLPSLTHLVSTDDASKTHGGASTAGQIVLCFVDSRKDWNFPFGDSCEVDVVWPLASSSLHKTSNQVYCEVRVRGLLSFCKYDVSLKVDVDPLELLSADIGIESDTISRLHSTHHSPSAPRQAKTFSFKRDLIDMLSASLQTKRGKPGSPRYIDVESVSTEGSILEENPRKVPLRIHFGAASLNGGSIIKYELQRLTIMSSSYYADESSDSTWKSIGTIAPTMALSYLDKIHDPFVVQYRVRAVTTIGAGPFTTSSEVSSDVKGMTVPVYTRYEDPTQLMNSPTRLSLNANKNLFSNKNDKHHRDLEKIIGGLVRNEVSKKGDVKDLVDEEWLQRLAKAIPFSSK
jgi:hypothetical protein